VVAFEWAGLEFEEKGYQVLATASAFAENLWSLEGFETLVRPKSSQRHDIGPETGEGHTFLPTGLSFAEGEGSDCVRWTWLSLDTDCS